MVVRAGLVVARPPGDDGMSQCEALRRDGTRCPLVFVDGRWCGNHARQDRQNAHGQPLLPDGTVDVRALCTQLDAYWNRGAGEFRP